MRRALIIFLMVIILSSGSLSLVHGDELKLGMDISTNHSTYFLKDMVNVTYFVFTNNGREVIGGNGTWYLNYSNDNSNVANGSITYGHGFFIINLAEYNISHAGGGSPYTITLVYRYENQTVSKSTLIYIMDPNSMWFNLFVSPVSGGYYPGTYAKLSIRAPVGNLSVNYLKIVYNGTSWKNITTLSLNKNGHLDYMFQIPHTWEPEKLVNITAKIMGATNSVNFTTQRDFGLYMLVQDSSGKYISGDEVTVAVLSSEYVDNAYYHFYVRTSQGELLYHFYTFQNYTIFSIPRSFSGGLIISCDVFNTTEKISTLEKTIHVDYSEMQVYFDRENFHGNDEFNAHVYFRSNVMKEPTFIYEIYEERGGYYDLVSSFISNETKIKISVPSSPPDLYRVVVKAVDGSRVQVAYGEINYSSFVRFYSEIITRSVYATGVFTPGEIIELRYSISGEYKRGILYYGFGDEFYQKPKVKYVNESDDGYITFKIPENIGSGVHAIHFKLVYDGGALEKDVFINVDANPPWSQYLIFTIPAGDFITLVILATAIIFTLVYIKYPRKEKKEKGKQESKEDIKDEILDEEL